MGWATKDGASISAFRVVRLECSRCGTVLTTRSPANDREIEDLIRQHARDKHGGIDRGYS